MDAFECVTYAVPLDDDWKVEYTIVERDGNAVIAAVRMCSIDAIDEQPITGTERIPEGGLTRRKLREVPMNAEVIARALTPHEIPLRGGGAVKLGAAGFSQAALDDAGKVRGRRRSDLLCAEAARIYVQACNSGARAPVQAVQEALAESGRHYSFDGVREILRDAERRGLRTGTTRGRAGGQLTLRAEEILAGAPGAA